MCWIPSEFLYGEGVCHLLHLFSLYFHLSYLLFLLSCARSSLASRACCCFLPRQPKRTADSRCAPSLLLMSSWATRSFGASWHQHVAWPANHSLRLYPEGRCALTYQEAQKEVGARRAVGKDLAPCHILGRLFCLRQLEGVLL